MNYLRPTGSAPPAARAVSNSFGFGGRNASLVFGARAMSGLRVWVHGIGLLGPGPGSTGPAAQRRAARRAARMRSAAHRAARRRRACRRRAPPRRRGGQARHGGRRRGRRAGAGRPRHAGHRVHLVAAASAPTATRCARRWPRRRRWSRRRASPTRCTTRRRATGTSRWRAAPPSTSLCAFDGSFGAGLLEAAAQCRAGAARRCCWWPATCPTPSRCTRVRPLPDHFGVALLLAPAGAALARGADASRWPAPQPAAPAAAATPRSTPAPRHPGRARRCRC